MNIVLDITVVDVERSGSVLEAIRRNIYYSNNLYEGQVGSSKMTTFTGKVVNRTVDDYAETALIDLDADAYIDVESGRAAYLDEDKRVQWTPKSRVCLVPPDYTQIAQYPASTAKMIEALNVHVDCSDLVRWKEISETIENKNR
jgi:hypothetical protein